MAYKKYIQRDGKLYGPYIYSSKRVDGKVISEYGGAAKKKSKKYLLILFGILLIAAIFYLLFSDGDIKGRVILGINANYEQSKPLEGVLNLVLKEGELIPSSSKIIFENTGQNYEFVLKNIVEEPVSEGDFYVEGASLSGNGEGYGIEGETTIYPELEFTMFVYKESDSGEESIGEPPSENITESSGETSIIEETPAENIIEPAGEPVEEPLAEETPIIEEPPAEETTTEIISGETESAPITGATVKGLGKLFGATGRVSMNLEKEIKGTVSEGKPFIYELEVGETAELKPKSVRLGSQELKDKDISFNIEENTVTVTTEYSEEIQNYGEDYIGDKEKKISIDLSNLNMSFEEGGLIVKIVYEENEIISLSTVLEDKKPVSNETSPEIPDLNETKNKTKIEVNETLNKTIKNVTIEDIGDFLTEEEKEILSREFGNISINIIKSESFKDKIIIYYNFSEYTSEFAYDSSLSDENLNIQMERDRIKWLKDIANSLLYEKTSPEEIERFNNTYSF